MLDRRRFLNWMITPAVVAAAGAVLRPGRALAAGEAALGETATPRETRSDERFWREIQQAFTVDRSLINLNNGGVSPSPAYVQ